MISSQELPVFLIAEYMKKLVRLEIVIMISMIGPRNLFSKLKTMFSMVLNPIFYEALNIRLTELIIEIYMQMKHYKQSMFTT